MGSELPGGGISVRFSKVLLKRSFWAEIRGKRNCKWCCESNWISKEREGRVGIVREAIRFSLELTFYMFCDVRCINLFCVFEYGRIPEHWKLVREILFYEGLWGPEFIFAIVEAFGWIWLAIFFQLDFHGEEILHISEEIFRQSVDWSIWHILNGVDCVRMCGSA
jgi:hypothetical protein